MGMEQELQYGLAGGIWIPRCCSCLKRLWPANALGLLVGSDVYSVVVGWSYSGPQLGPKGPVDYRQDISK